VSATAPPATFHTGHVGLNVSDVERAVGFYTGVFGFSVQGRGTEPGRRYAFLGDDERLVLTLWEQSEGAFATARPGLHHLSFRVDDMAAVAAVEARLRAAGATLVHDGIVPHSEGAASGGVFFTDPDGIRLEVFAAEGAQGHAPAPSGAAPTCGFF